MKRERHSLAAFIGRLVLGLVQRNRGRRDKLASAFRIAELAAHARILVQADFIGAVALRADHAFIAAHLEAFIIDALAAFARTAFIAEHLKACRFHTDAVAFAIRITGTRHALPPFIARHSGATALHALAFRADLAFSAVFLHAIFKARIVIAFRLDARLRFATGDRLARIDLNAFTAFIAVATRIVRARLVRTRILGFAYLIDTLLRIGAFRTRIVVIRFVNTGLACLVADLVIRTDLGSAKILAHLIDAFLTVGANFASTQIFTDLIYTFLTVCTRITRIRFINLVLAHAVFARLILSTLIAWILNGLVFTLAILADLISSTLAASIVCRR